VAHIF